MKKREVVIFAYKDELLLVKRKKGDLNYYCFPGGTVEENENIKKAALREIEEELNYCIQGSLKEIIYLNKKDINEESFYFYKDLNDAFEPKLKHNSPEFKKISDNYLFEPVWINYSSIKNLNIFPIPIKNLLLKIHPREIKEKIIL